MLIRKSDSYIDGYMYMHLHQIYLHWCLCEKKTATYTYICIYICTDILKLFNQQQNFPQIFLSNLICSKTFHIYSNNCIYVCPYKNWISVSYIDIDVCINICTDAHVKILQVYINSFVLSICTGIFAQMTIWGVPGFGCKGTRCFWRITRFGVSNGERIATAADSRSWRWKGVWDSNGEVRGLFLPCDFLCLLCIVFEFCTVMIVVVTDLVGCKY